MIDLHSHILPDFDDGPRSMEVSLAMLRQAAEAGTTDIVASSHANMRYAFDPAVAERKIAELSVACPEGPRIHYGCELHVTPENLDRALRYPERYSIAGRGYLLLELSDLQIPRTMSAIFAQLIQAGLQPIVAHPERNPLLQKKLDTLETWVADGCLLQVTAHSLLGRFGRTAKAAAERLMQRRLVQFLASDAHHPEHRPATMRDAWDHVERNFGKDTAERLFVENPRTALNPRIPAPQS
jgi:protein-tyrosine phosphatase